MNGAKKFICTKKRYPLVVDDETFFPVTDDSLTEKEMEKACRELGETEERRNECLAELKEKITTNGTLKCLMDDWYLLRFLRYRKFNCDETYRTMENIGSIRTKHAEAFSISPKMEQFLNYHGFYCMPYTDGEGKVIFMSDFGTWNPDEISFMEAVSFVTTVTDIMTLIPRCQVNGIISIWDAKGLTLRHMSEIFSYTRLWLFFNIVQNCIPVRIKKAIIINCNPLIRMVYQIVRKVLKKKIRKRVVILGDDLNELREHINPRLLPKTLGGVLEEKECRMNRVILDNLPYLRQERSFTLSSEAQ